MALENAGFPAILNQFSTTSVDANDILLVYKRSTGQVHGILGSDAFTVTTDVNNFIYSSTQTYNLDDVVVFDNKWWRSIEASNTGNIPQTVSPFWVQLNTISEISIPDWIAGLYLTRAVVFEGTQLYRIKSTVALPFNSTGSPTSDTANWEVVSVAVTSSQIQNNQFTFAVDTGSINALVITLAPALSSYVQGQSFFIKAANLNSGATTVNINGLGAIPVVTRSGQALSGGEMPAGSISEFVIDEVSSNIFRAQLMNTSGGGSSGGGTSPFMLQSAVVENASRSTVNAVFQSGVNLTQAGWSVEVELNGIAKNISAISGSAANWDFTIDNDAEPFADVITLKYTSSLGNSTDANGDFLQDQSILVTNNVLPTLYYQRAIPGESSNQTSMIMDSQQNYTLPNEWTFITWLKPPVTITNLEGIFSTLLTNPGPTGLQNFHLWSLETNLEDSNFFNGFTRIYRSSASTIVTSPILTSFSGNIVASFEQGQPRDKVMFAITASFNSVDVDYRVCSYMNGVQMNCFENLDSIPASMAFNWLSDRGVLSRFGDSQIAGARFYPDLEMTPAQMALEFNRGYGRAPQATVLFDVVAETPIFNALNNSYFIPDNSGNFHNVRLDNFATPASADVAFSNDVSATDEIQITNILFTGNSIVNGQGTGAEPEDFPSLCLNKLGDVNRSFPGNYAFFGVKNGIGGVQTPEMITNRPTLDDKYFSNVYLNNILVFLEGGNHLVAGASTTDVFNSMVSYCQAAKTAAPSRQIIICTILPRNTSLAEIPGTFDTNRQTINNDIILAVDPPWDAVADIGSDSTIGTLAASQNTSLYPDGIHPSNTTNEIIAEILRDRIFDLITSDTTSPLLSNVSTSNVAATTVDFNAQINEEGAIYWAVYPSVTAQQNIGAIESGTVSPTPVAFGFIVSQGSMIETVNIAGLTSATAYRVHYFARDISNNETTPDRTAEFTTL